MGRTNPKPQEIAVGADREVIGYDEDSRNECLAVGQLTLQCDRHELAEELGQVSLGKFLQYRLFPLTGIHHRDMAHEL